MHWKTIPLGTSPFPSWPLSTLRPLDFGQQSQYAPVAGALITTAVTRLVLEKKRSEALKDETPADKPKELTDLIKWEFFWEQ